MILRTAPLALLLLVLPGPAGAVTAWVASTTIQLVDVERGSLEGQLTVAEDQVVAEIAFDPASM